MSNGKKDDRTGDRSRNKSAAPRSLALGLALLAAAALVGCAKEDAKEDVAAPAALSGIEANASETPRLSDAPEEALDEFGKRLAASGVAFDLKPTVKNALIGNSDRLARPRKKLIEFGWDCPTTGTLRRNWVQMEKDAPFDGVVYKMEGQTPDGRVVGGGDVFTDERWDASYFDRCVDDLNSCDFKRYLNNFALLNFGLNEIDWADDDAWAIASANAAVCARVARETNGGLCFDLETYAYPLFRYDAEHSHGRTFEETKKLARRRGAEFGGAIFKEYPNVVVLAFWLNSGNIGAGKSANVDRMLFYIGAALMPSFIDGLLDAAPSEATLVDACEDGYYMNGAEYDRTALDILSASGPCARLVSPENRVKYRTQVQAGFGFYLDIYSNPEGSQYYRGAEPGKTRFETLVDNLKAARAASDEYVWVYGESARWFPKEPQDDPENLAPLWDELLPGARALVLEMTDPVGSLREDFEFALEAEKEGKIANEVVNGDFSSFETDEGSPRFEGWGACWFDVENGARPIALDGAAGIVGTGGYYSQSFSVKPNDTILFSAKVKGTGSAVPIVGGAWSDENGGAMEIRDWEKGAVSLGSLDVEPDANGFRTIVGRAVVPNDARNFDFALETASAGPNDSVLFDDVRFYASIRAAENDGSDENGPSGAE